MADEQGLISENIFSLPCVTKVEPSAQLSCGGQGRGEEKEQITPLSVQDSETSSWYMEKAWCWNVDHFSA